MILRKLVVGPISSNCYIVGSESTGKGIVIDPGASGKKILSNVDELGLNINLIVLTHGHPDHAAAVKDVKKAMGAEVAIHTEDAKFMRRLSLVVSCPSSPDRLLKDGDIIHAGDLSFVVLHTPGHSPGGICLQGYGVLFSGDTLFRGSVGRTDFSSGNHHQLISSIHSKLLVLPDDTVVYPGHGADTTVGAERRTNPFLQN